VADPLNNSFADIISTFISKVGNTPEEGGVLSASDNLISKNIITGEGSTLKKRESRRGSVNSILTSKERTRTYNIGIELARAFSSKDKNVKIPDDRDKSLKKDTLLNKVLRSTPLTSKSSPDSIPTKILRLPGKLLGGVKDKITKNNKTFRNKAFDKISGVKEMPGKLLGGVKEMPGKLLGGVKDKASEFLGSKLKMSQGYKPKLSQKIDKLTTYQTGLIYAEAFYNFNQKKKVDTKAGTILSNKNKKGGKFGLPGGAAGKGGDGILDNLIEGGLGLLGDALLASALGASALGRNKKPKTPKTPKPPKTPGGLKPRGRVGRLLQLGRRFVLPVTAAAAVITRAVTSTGDPLKPSKTPKPKPQTGSSVPAKPSTVPVKPQSLVRASGSYLKKVPIVGTALGVGLGAMDYSDVNKQLKEGKITKKEATVKKSKVVGRTGGGLLGAALAGAGTGALMGTVLPGAGNIIGGLVGIAAGIGGYYLGDKVGEKVGEKIGNKIAKKDKKSTPTIAKDSKKIVTAQPPTILPSPEKTVPTIHRLSPHAKNITNTQPLINNISSTPASIDIPKVKQTDGQDIKEQNKLIVDQNNLLVQLLMTAKEQLNVTKKSDKSTAVTPPGLNIANNNVDSKGSTTKPDGRSMYMGSPYSISPLIA